MPQPPGPDPILAAALPLAHFNPDHHQYLLDALEEARKKVCVYPGPTCDCKYGLISPTDPAEPVPINAIHCSHRRCEHTGCPELRNLIKQVKAAQRETWGRRSKDHERTSHGWLCCTNHPAYDPASNDPMLMLYDGSLAGATCGGPWFCFTCLPETDRIHGLLPPLAEQPA